MHRTYSMDRKEFRIITLYKTVHVHDNLPPGGPFLQRTVREKESPWKALSHIKC